MCARSDNDLFTDYKLEHNHKSHDQSPDKSCEAGEWLKVTTPPVKLLSRTSA
jgi:hypothetical protein